MFARHCLSVDRPNESPNPKETPMTATDIRTDVLTEEMLARFDQRAPLYDRENRFFTEDFEELKAAGYLATSLPTEYGGAGLTLAEINRMQRRIAYVAPAT